MITFQFRTEARFSSADSGGDRVAADTFRAFLLGDDRVYPVGRKALRRG